MEPKPYTDDELLMGMAAGNEPAFRQIYDRYAAKVYHIALRYLDSPFSAQDAVQEVFTRVWQKRAELTGLASFDAWLTSVTRNYLINQLQKKIPAPLTEGADIHAQPARHDHPAEYRELEALVQQAIRRLPPKQQQVYRLRQEGLSHKEIAAEMGISYNTAREHMSQALRSVRQFLETRYEYLIPLLYLYLVRELF